MTKRILAIAALALLTTAAFAAQWPEATQTARPWAYWWWMGSAVDEANLTRELERYRDAGMGGVHVIPIYGAKGDEARYVEYLSPRWMALLEHAVSEAARLGLGVDMTTGTGWNFGGPNITRDLACARVWHKRYKLKRGEPAPCEADADYAAVVAYGPDGAVADLADPDARAAWSAPDDDWQLYAVRQEACGPVVERAAPGGAGPMLNTFYPKAMTTYLERFDKAFAGREDAVPRAFYHDSYEYRGDWAPGFFEAFQARRGYDLKRHLPALFDKAPLEEICRVKCDYRETISDLMVEDVFGQWARWAHALGAKTRNQAHGSPGHLLDLYALAKIPETEMFHTDNDPLVSKFASSAAHVLGKPLVAAETGTWVAEHFTVTLGTLKRLVDRLFISGVNHVVFHGTCYSPDDAPWPGWVFYASTQFNPRNAIWRDAPVLNGYIARCQAFLQGGRPDNDLLVYWPIHDLWHAPNGMVQHLTVHRREWFAEQPVGKLARTLWEQGHAFDYISDRQLQQAQPGPEGIVMPGGAYRGLLVPRCVYMPRATAEKLAALAAAGACVIFEDALPRSLPGLGASDDDRAAFDAATARLAAGPAVVTPDPLAVLDANLGIHGEPMVARELRYERRAYPGGHVYFITNRGQNALEDWVVLRRPAASAEIYDPMTGRIGAAALKPGAPACAVFLQLAPGQSLFVRLHEETHEPSPPWAYWRPGGAPAPITGPWRVAFIEGGPEAPAAYKAPELASWTACGDPEAERFAGTARYATEFDKPADDAEAWRLDLGRVCESARVRLNGEDVGALLGPDYTLVVDDLRPEGNRLEIEVTNLSANRVRDLDRRGVVWRRFHDINFVNIDYKPFDASQWPVRASGLLGPVTLTPLSPLEPLP